jgi:thermitase
VIQVKRSAIPAAILSAAVVLGASVSAQAQEKIPGEYLVKYRTNSFATIMSLKSTPALKIMDHHQVGQIMKVKVTLAQEAMALASILKNPNVEYVVPNIKLHTMLHSVKSVDVTTMAKTQDQWANKKTRVEEAWAKAGNKGSRNVKVAVIDTGVDYNHASLKSNMITGYDFRDSDADPMDLTSAQNPGHGTHCAGSVGGNDQVDGGIAGASADVSIMPLRFLGADGSGDLNNGIKAIDHAIQQGAQIISASWGATVPRAQAQPLVDAVQRASDAGVIMIMAAANDGRNNDRTEVFPTNAQFDNTISVAASGPNDEKASFSNFGLATVHVAAPGVDIVSTLPKNKYGKLSGTSMATPLVSGIAAFLKAQDPSLTGAQIRALLQITGAKAQIEVACNCRVDMLAATEVVMAKKMFVTPAAASLAVGEAKQFGATYAKGALTFAVADAAIGEIDATGKFTAKADGQTTITVKDASGATSTSLPIRVGKTPGGENPGGGGECPLGDPAICQIICGVMPDAPWCAGGGGGGGGGLPELPFVNGN